MTFPHVTEGIMTLCSRGAEQREHLLEIMSAVSLFSLD